MNPEPSREQIALYLLDELAEAERAAFEIELMRTPDLQDEVRQCAETMGLLVSRCAVAEETPVHLWCGIETLIQREPGYGTLERPRPQAADQARAPRLWRAWLWPAAAALLLAANIAQWLGHERRRGDQQRRIEELSRAAADSRGGAVAVDLGRARGSDTAGTTAPEAGRRAAEGDESVDGAVGVEQRIAEKYRRLEADYESLVDAVAPFVRAGVLQLDANGLWTTELRSYAGAEVGVAPGLWDRVRDLAPASGVALLPDRWRMPGGQLLDPGAWGSSNGGVTTDGNNPPGIDAPFAVAIVNADEGMGYLDLYNLPLVPAGQELHIWLRGETDVTFTSVGAVPGQLSGGSAGLVFRVPPAAGDARRVLITMEPSGGVSQPSGPVIIQGP